MSLRTEVRASRDHDRSTSVLDAPRAPGDGPHMLFYLLTGGIAAVANYGSRFFFSRWLPFEFAVGAAYAIGMVCAFVLMRRFAFAPGRQGLLRQALIFAAVNLFALLQTLVVSSVLLRAVLPALGIESYAEALAHGVGVVVPVVTSYFGHRRFTFR